MEQRFISTNERQGAIKVQIAKLRRYFDILQSETCQCGQVKTPSMSLCRHCFGLLPRSIQRGLYRPMGSGYEQEYDRAIEFLRQVA